MPEALTMFLTWTTYGSWLPGDGRGWNAAGQGEQLPQPFLREWSFQQLCQNPISLTAAQRQKVEQVFRDHAQLRHWPLHAMAVRSNHVHLVVTAPQKPSVVRDQFKAYGTRVLKEPPEAIESPRIWTRGGDCRLIDNEESLERVVCYVLEAQDRMDRPK